MTQNNQEIELKLAIPAEAIAAFRRDPLLANPARHGTVKLLNQYFDTPGLSLRRRGIALRVRKSGRTWLQTVKQAGIVEGGLSTRPEWEQRFLGHFDFSAIDDAALRRLLERHQTQLEAVFTTDFRRESWIVEPEPGCRIEVALDRGTISARDASRPLAEVELELLDGTPAQLLSFGCALAERHPLYPDERSKAMRGYALFAGEPALSPRHARHPALDHDADPEQAFRDIAAECLSHIAANLLGAQDSDDPEYAHQLRVGVRRLRSAFKLFEPVLPDDFSETWQPQLRALAGIAGGAREWDVLLSQIIAPVARLAPDYPGLKALTFAAQVRRDAAHAKMRERLRNPEFGHLVILLMRAILTPAMSIPRAAASPETPPAPRLAQFAALQLRQLGRRAARAAAAAEQGDVARLHALRLRLKRLRYAMEFVGPLVRSPNALRLRKIVSLQTSLGLLNDLSVSGPLMESLASEYPSAREAIAFIGGHHLATWRDRAVPDAVRGIRWKDLARDWKAMRKR